MKKQISYFIKNHRMVIHLLFGTRYFGTNNKTHWPYESIFKARGLKKITQLVKNYKMMRVRAFIGFIPLNQAIDIFPSYARRNGHKKIITTDEKNTGPGESSLPKE